MDPPLRWTKFCHWSKGISLIHSSIERIANQGLAL